MTHPWARTRPVSLALATVAVLSAFWLAAPDGLGRAQAQGEGTIPTGPELMLSPPFDVLTLSDGTVLRVDPVFPRPLPPYDPAKDPARKANQKGDPPPREGNIGLPGDPPAPRNGNDDAQISELTVHALEGEVRDFTLRRASVRSVAYFEDLLLAEGARLVNAGDFDRAFECHLRVKATSPDWKGLDDHVNRLLYAEGSAALLEGEGERGLRLLRELSGRKPDFPGLAEKLAESYGERATRALEVGRYDQGRKLLRDGGEISGDHPALAAARSRFVSLAAGNRDRAAGLAGPAKLDALADALRVWPTLEGAETPYRRAFADWPTLDVGVPDVPRGVGPWVRSPADERVTRLLYLPTLVRADDEALRGNADGQLASGVTATDLGGRLVVRLRGDVPWSDRSRPVSSADLSRAITDTADPSATRYKARWADLLDRVETPDGTTVEIRLTRPLLNPGAWLMGPVGPAHGGSDGRVTVGPGDRELVGDGPYRLSGTTGDRFEVVAAAGGADDAPKVRRVRETRYPTAAAALDAFDRGEVTLLADVPAREAAALAGREGVKVGRYAQPRVHQIALDGRNPALRNRSLRRGLSYAIDRRVLLEEAVLGRPPDATNLPADGVFPRGSYADAADVKPLAYDPLLARMLVAGAKKELGLAALELTFEYPATPDAQSAAPKIVEALTLAGVVVKAVERPESELEAGLREGQRFDLAYRALPCNEPLMDAGPLLSPAYDAPPSVDPLAALASPRILQILLLLERAPEFPTARGLLTQIDRECRDELPVIPLWQLEHHYAWKARLDGPQESTGRLYDGIETWEVAPWFARDPS